MEKVEGIFDLDSPNWSLYCEKFNQDNAFNFDISGKYGTNKKSKTVDKVVEKLRECVKVSKDKRGTSIICCTDSQKFSY
jgi:hypothetical protein